MGQMRKPAALKPVRKRYDAASLRCACTGAAAEDPSVELRRLRADYARVTQELQELKAATAQMVRYLV